MKLFLLIQTLLVEVFSSGLYLNDKGIVVLHPSNYTTTVLNSENIWIVEFYSKYCGHCVNFAPKVKFLGQRIDGWSKFVKIGTLHCAEYMEFCRKESIEYFPEIKYYGPKTLFLNQSIEYYGRSNVEELKNFIQNKIFYHFSKNNILTFPENYELNRDYFKKGKKSYKYLLVAFEGTKMENFSMTLTLDYSFRNDIKVMKGTTKTAEKLNIKEFPCVVFITKENQFQIIKEVDEFKILKQIYSLMNERIPVWLEPFINEINQHSSNRTTISNSNKETPRNIENSASMEDLFVVVHYLFKIEVWSLHKELKESSSKVLIDFIKSLEYSFPLLKARKSFTELSNYLLEVKRNEKIIIYEKIKNKIDSWNMLGALNSPKITSESQPWVQCKGSTSNYRGYTCGLWMLLHTMTINCDEKNNEFCGGKLLVVIRNFISEFFSCLECRKHFLSYVDRNSDTIESWDKKKVILWLWNIHNIVNQRLKNDTSSDPMFPKRMFPTPEQCAECYASNEENETPDPEKSYLYLLKFYKNFRVPKKTLLANFEFTFWNPFFLIVCVIGVSRYLFPVFRRSMHFILRVIYFG